MTEIDKIIVEREEDYGNFIEMADIVKRLKAPIELHAHKFTPAQKFALEMIAVKMARLINGNPWHADSWDDIAGYAKLGSGEKKPVNGTCSRCVKRDTRDCPADGHPAADSDTFYCAEFEGGER